MASMIQPGQPMQRFVLRLEQAPTAGASGKLAKLPAWRMVEVYARDRWEAEDWAEMYWRGWLVV